MNFDSNISLRIPSTMILRAWHYFVISTFVRNIIPLYFEKLMQNKNVMRTCKSCNQNEIESCIKKHNDFINLIWQKTTKETLMPKRSKRTRRFDVFQSHSTWFLFWVKLTTQSRRVNLTQYHLSNCREWD